MNMTLRHLEIFQQVAETGSFTKAAKHLYITQSAVSHAIRDLEDMAGTPLFDRLSKTVQLTRAGKLLLEDCKPVLAACFSLESRLKSLEQASPIHLVSNITIANFYLPGFLKRFQSIYPDTSVTVDVVPAAFAADYLRRGKADLALSEGALPSGPFLSLRLGSYDLKAVCAPGYRKGCSSLTLEELCREKLLLREPGSAIRDTLDSQLYLAGLTLYPTWCSVNSSALLEAAKAGLGITILPEAYVSEEIKNQRLRELSVPDLTLKNDMFAMWHKDKYLSEPVRRFLQECC